MEDNHVQPFDLRHQDHQPRRFVYRAAQPDADHSTPCAEAPTPHAHSRRFPASSALDRSC